jgi:hypothetical protein
VARLDEKATDVRVKLASGKILDAPAGTSLLHDPDGVWWPKCSCLVMRIHRTHKPLTPTIAERAYFGRTHGLRAGKVSLPPKDLAAWSEIGEVTHIWYLRTGKRAPGPFHHKMHGGWFDFGKHPVLLYRFGKIWRLELGAGCTLDDRGFVRP